MADDEFRQLVRELTTRNVRFVLVGIAGANYFAPAAGAVCSTPDRDLFLPQDTDNLTRARDACDEAGLRLHVNLTLVMAGFEFEHVWNESRHFVVDGVDIPVARLTHIVASKAEAGREKDRLFLATHAEALRQLLDPPK